MLCMNLIIRHATERDVEGILEIFNHALIHTTAIYSYEPYSLQKMRDWFNEKKRLKEPLYVAISNDKVAGYVTYGEFRKRPAYKYTVEHSIYVHKNFRKQGIANMLMEKIIAVAEENGIHSLMGGIDAENEVSILFHKKFGFKEVGHIREVGFKFNRWLDLKFMQLILDTPKHPVEG